VHNRHKAEINFAPGIPDFGRHALRGVAARPTHEFMMRAIRTSAEFAANPRQREASH
jgi:hypothetical protein